MKNNNMLLAVGVCSILTSGSVMAFGNINSGIAVTGGSRLTPSQSYSIKITVPTELAARSKVVLTTAPSSKMHYMDFDAKNIPVHELPPLPLTLDAPEAAP
ncbi:MAG: hypothetical protein P8Y28_13715 [Gammaproteobacteria bacterium]|jgi:hypothetical protein